KCRERGFETRRGHHRTRPAATPAFHEPPAPVSQWVLDPTTPSTMGGTMGAKQELLQQAEQEYEGLKAAIKDLDEAQMSQVWLGSWGVREILAHITGWHREMIPALERLGRGEAPYPDGAYDDFDSWNARFVE